MLDRRKKSKILPIFFLFLQITAFLLASYFLYMLLVGLGMFAQLVLVTILVINIFAIIKFFTRYFEIKNRTKYMDYEHFGKKGKS